MWCVVTALCLVLEEDVCHWALNLSWRMEVFCLFYPLDPALCAMHCFPSAGGVFRSPCATCSRKAEKPWDRFPKHRGRCGRAAHRWLQLWVGWLWGHGDSVPAAPACPGLYLPLVPPQGAELGAAGALQHPARHPHMLVAATTTQTPKLGQLST